MESQDISYNQINKLSSRYNKKLQSNLNKHFIEEYDRAFLYVFYDFLNYEKVDYVFDLDEIWKWMGHVNKTTSITMLKRFFTIDLDYKSIMQDDNKEKLLLNLKNLNYFV